METRTLSMQAMQSISTKYRLHIDLKINLLLCLHIFYKIVDKSLFQTCQMDIFWDCSYCLLATQLLLQKQPAQKIQDILNLHLICNNVCISLYGEYRNIRDTSTRNLLYYVIVAFRFFYVILHQIQFVYFNQHTIFGIATIM